MSSWNSGASFWNSGAKEVLSVDRRAMHRSPQCTWCGPDNPFVAPAAWMYCCKKCFLIHRLTICNPNCVLEMMDEDTGELCKDWEAVMYKEESCLPQRFLKDRLIDLPVGYRTWSWLKKWTEQKEKEKQEGLVFVPWTWVQNMPRKKTHEKKT